MMLVNADDPMADYEETMVQAAQLRQLLRWLAVVCFVCVPLNLAVAYTSGGSVFPLIAGIAGSLCGVSLLALALLNRSFVRPAAFLAATGLLAVSMAASYILPATTVAMTAVPLMVAAMLLPYLNQRATAAFLTLCPLVALSIFWLGTQRPHAEVSLAGTLIGALTAGLVSLLTLLLCWQFSRRLNTTLSEVRTGNIKLEQARDELEDKVALRTADLQAVLDDVCAHAEAQASLLAENEQQRTLIREMSVPILPVSTSAIVIPLVGVLDSERLQTMQEHALQTIEQRAVRHALLDITGVSLIDSQVAQGLISLVHAARLLGAEVVLVGVRPEVAQTLVGLDLRIGGVITRHSLQQGILYTLDHARAQASKSHA